MKNRTIPAAMLAIALGLSACGENPEDDHEEAPSQDETSSEGAQAEEEESEDEAGEDEEGSESSENLGIISSQLIPEEGESYIQLRGGFNPRLAVWTIHEDEDRLEMVEYNCLGQEDTEGAGEIEVRNAETGVHRVHWDDGDNPRRGTRSEFTNFTWTKGEEMDLSRETLTTDHDPEIDAWASECRALGDFLLP